MNHTIRHTTNTQPTDLPLPEDLTTDICTCGAAYSTRDCDPDPTIYGLWLDHHMPHLEEPQ